MQEGSLKGRRVTSSYCNCNRDGQRRLIPWTTNSYLGMLFFLCGFGGAGEKPCNVRRLGVYGGLLLYPRGRERRCLHFSFRQS